MYMKKLFRKVKNRSGETIAETLVALLIAALALTMLAGAITTATGIITRSSKKIDAYFNDANANLVEMQDINKIKTGSVVLTEENAGASSLSQTISVNYGESNMLNTNNPVISFRIKE